MSTEIIKMLRCVEGVTVAEGVNRQTLNSFEHEAGFALPNDHSALLVASNGLMVSHGYCRLFGIGPTAIIDAVQWNHPQCWKFAWDGRGDSFWCFGETGWGDQYAYSLDDLRAGTKAPVYFLDHMTLTPVATFPSFIVFLFQEIVRNAVNPYHEMTKLAKLRFGLLGKEFHVMHSPSQLFGAPDTIENVQLMNAVAAMTIEGDIATQLDNGSPDQRVVSVESFQDEQQRIRLRLVWEQQ